MGIWPILVEIVKKKKKEHQKNKEKILSCQGSRGLF